MKISHLPLPLIMTLVVAIFGIMPINASTEEEKIREVIQNYFEKRYRSRQVNQIEDFREFMDGSSQADAFLKSETDKLAIEIYNAKVHHLGYTQYEFTLDFNNISIDKNHQTATVLLTEGHDVVFEISEMISRTEPVVSKMRNLDHTILLSKTQNGWKIVSDHYEDYLWRMLRATNVSKDELLRIIDDVQTQTSNIAEMYSPTSSTCNLPADASTHTYTRNGSVAYAHQYATSPNPAYYYFPSPYGDCTNFVNQAIHHGSNAEEVGSNTYGWYYNNNQDYSASWTDVQFLYDFITQYYVWGKGPEGCNIDKFYALKGDLVQFEWFEDEDHNGIDDNTAWDHTVIIVNKWFYAEEPFFEVAGHSDDVDNYPLENFTYASRRFVRIERIDGYYNLYIPVIVKDASGYSQRVFVEPYPAPMEMGEPAWQPAYPAP